MKIHYITRPSLSIFVWIMMQSLLSFSANAQPQTFEFAYGSNTCAEKGFRGVEPVNQQVECENGGYIAVGYSTENLNGTGCGPDDNVYVVRTNANGTRMWEYVYDIGLGGPGSYDQGVAIRELPGGIGYIITGTTRANALYATSDVFLLKIDCDGNPLPIGSGGTGFTWIYGASNVNEYATDLIIATTGNGTTTNPGDFVVSGWAERPWPNMSDGLLLRTTSTGTLIWNRTYNVAGTSQSEHDDYFHTLIEAQISGAGDIIAAGHTMNFSDNYGAQALVVRVNGNTGNIGPAPQGVAHFGGANSDERFNAAEELVGNPEWGNLVFAGRTVTIGVAVDIYLVKTAPNPCDMRAQNTIDHVSGLEDDALGIVQVSTPLTPFCPFGNLAIVGQTELNCQNPSSSDPDVHSDALLLNVSPFTLTAVAGKHFGSQFGCGRNEAFHSVMDCGQNDPGFILCGYTEDNPNFGEEPPVPDPSDLYLVKTDGNGATGCEEEWNFNQQAPSWEMFCAAAVAVPTLLPRDLVTVSAEKNNPEEVCPFDGQLMISPPANGSNLGGLQERELNVWDAGSLLFPTSAKKESNSDKNNIETGTIQARGNR